MARRLRTAKRGHPKYDYSPTGERVPWNYYNGPAQHNYGEILNQQLAGGTPHPAHGVARAMTEQGMNPLLALMAAFQAYNDHPNFGGGAGQGGIDFGSFFQRPAPPTPEQQARLQPFVLGRPGPYQGPPLKPSAPMIPDPTGLPPEVSQSLG